MQMRSKVAYPLVPRCVSFYQIVCLSQETRANFLVCRHAGCVLKLSLRMRLLLRILNSRETSRGPTDLSLSNYLSPTRPEESSGHPVGRRQASVLVDRHSWRLLYGLRFRVLRRLVLLRPVLSVQDARVHGDAGLHLPQELLRLYA